MSQQQLMSAMGIGGMVSQGMNPATQGMNPMRPLPTGFQGPGMMGAGMMGAGSMPMMPGQMRPLPPGLPPAAGGMMGGGMMGAGLMPGLAQAMAPPPMPTGFTEGMLQARHFGIYCVVDGVCVCVRARARECFLCVLLTRLSIRRRQSDPARRGRLYVLHQDRQASAEHILHYGCVVYLRRHCWVSVSSR